MGYLDAPKTGNTVIDRFFSTLATKVSALFDRVRALDEAEVAVVSADFAMTGEGWVNYVGAGGHTITIPPANAIPGRRARPRYVVNNGAAAITLAATGQLSDGTAHTINGASTVLLDIGATALLMPDGDAKTRWIGGVAPSLFRTLNGVTAILGPTTGGSSTTGSLVLSPTQCLITMPADNNAGQVPLLIRQGFVARVTCVGSNGATTAIVKVGQTGGGANNCDLQVFGTVTVAQLAQATGAIALGGGAAPTLGTIGGSGPASAAQAGWMKVNLGGTNYFLPVWT